MVRVEMGLVEAQSKKNSHEVFSALQDEQEIRQTLVENLLSWVKTGWGKWGEESLRKILGLDWEQKI